jgi:nitrate/TMAO reductase-like tetraheme cytochrome c subunit
MMKGRLPESYYNKISIAGTVLAVIALFMFVFLYAIASMGGITKAYEGLVIFMVIPVFIIVGLILIPVGMIITAHRRRRAVGKPPAFVLPDLNKPTNRRALRIFAGGTIVFLFLSAMGSYQAYNFTDSVLFCGTLCHTVMKPEYTTYLVSPHARVPCADCHVGEGASWYVKSKLSGLHQVYAVLANSYPRPIPVPIKNLRPARETCERCHWPQKVYGKQQRLKIHYLPDESNTRWDIEMLLNTGPGNQALGFKTGIHWHVDKDVRVEYFPTDPTREKIGRVTLTNLKTGEKTVFDSSESKAGGAAVGKLPSRVMDCIDCHNSPSHNYKGPLDFINEAVAEGTIDPALPFIKYASVEACLKSYPTTAAAREGIAASIKEYYAKKHPEIAKARAADIERAAAGTVRAFLGNTFPEMKVTWAAYPDHIGHFSSLGCFRCHDGEHRSASGQTIRNDCNLCHLIIGQGPAGKMEFGPGNSSLSFKHPVDVGGAEEGTACSDCHATPPIDF